MDIHSGTWAVSATVPPSSAPDPSDLVFTSATAVNVIFTVTKNADTVLPINVNLNGTLAPNGAMPYGECARTFRFTGVTTIHVVAGALPSGFQSLLVNGAYQITVL